MAYQLYREVLTDSSDPRVAENARESVYALIYDDDRPEHGTLRADLSAYSDTVTLEIQYPDEETGDSVTIPRRQLLDGLAALYGEGKRIKGLQRASALPAAQVQTDPPNPLAVD